MGHAALLQDITVERGELVAHGAPAVLVLLLDENHFDALLGEFAGAGDAGKAVAGDDDVAVDFLSELSDLRRGDLPVFDDDAGVLGVVHAGSRDGSALGCAFSLGGGGGIG